MPSDPQLLKVITFVIDPTGDNEDFSLDVLDVELVPTPGDIQTVRTLDGVSHSDAEAETWALRLRAIIDWDTTRPGLAYYLWNNRGEQKAFRFRKDTAAISTTNPEVQGTVTLVPLPYGGVGNEYAEAEVLLPLDGDPTIDTTP
jgi:hypothetical protein